MTMAKRGRKPKPTALKIFEGNPGKRPLPKNEPKPSKGVVKPPFVLDATGKKVWNSMLSTSPDDMITPHDALSLWQFCQAWSDFFIADKEVKKLKGYYFVYSEKGGVYLHPAVGMRNQAFGRICKLGPLFGWTPSDRASMNFDGGEKSPEELLMEMLEGKSSGSA